jgi:hypothetical protein
MALNHIRLIFNAGTLDRIASKALVKELIDLEEADAAWAEYRGPQGNERPRKLTQSTIAALLRPFGIYPRMFGRTSTTKGFRGYQRADFVDAWRRYCDEGESPPGPRLRLVARTP